MYQWYSRAAVCYVYLSDVSYWPTDFDIVDKLHCSLEGNSIWRPRANPYREEWQKHRVRNSSWFKRGWTLQELLAPHVIKFLDRDWIFIGDRSQLRNHISETTGIPRQYLGPNHRDASIAQTMSWVSHRKTSRGEDLAYCMLGLFDINMPLLYGEGADRAFFRLQVEILRTSNDESIFAWIAPLQFSDILAPHPEHFQDSGDFRPITGRTNTRPHYTMTNKGLQISIPSTDLPLSTASALTMQLYCNRTSRRDLSRKIVASNRDSLSRTSREETLEGDCASSEHALVIHLFRHEDTYLRFRCHTLQDTLRKPRPLSSAEGNPNNLCATYIVCSRVPLSSSNEAQRLESDYKKSSTDLSSVLAMSGTNLQNAQTACDG